PQREGSPFGVPGASAGCWNTPEPQASPATRRARYKRAEPGRPMTGELQLLQGVPAAPPAAAGEPGRPGSDTRFIAVVRSAGSATNPPEPGPAAVAAMAAGP